jgi:hypothetical protein
MCSLWLQYLTAAALLSLIDVGVLRRCGLIFRGSGFCGLCGLVLVEHLVHGGLVFEGLILDALDQRFASGEGDEDGSERDERAAGDLERRQVFSEQEPREEDDQDDAQFVDRCDA